METIKSKQDISDLFSSGKRIHTPYLTFIVLPKKQHGLNGRVAFIAGKKYGNAVWRNAAKRRMREVCRQVGGPWEGNDVVLLAKRNIVSVSYWDVVEACRKALERSHLV